LDFTNTNGNKVNPLKPRGVKYLQTIGIIFCKVLKFVTMFDNKNENKLIEGIDFYYTPEGYKCFTEKYHLKRGYCCKSGCKHCPYGFDKKTGQLKK
jgi:hypothetical protein